MSNQRKALLGERYYTNNSGELQIIGYAEKSLYEVRFFSTGYTTKARLCKIKAGKVKDKLLPKIYGVACIGVGKYNSKNSPVLYSRYKHMLARCYSGNYPHYEGCTVCERWLNFQNFAEDCLSLPGYTDSLSGLDLDKDTLVEGNKIYSPSTCQFISRADNFRFALK
ncbi:hypothetical protein [Enterobacter pseudoroggenkampii]|uniref:hypothetical protein n=1 Tax=Enterobacter pseudoroggenkampii TaxID=2996112 RepID=UPI0022646ED1|nr:hypothetical protein [Enterobacter pseudoroggenkampii]MCX8289116.1 hypothetical protein [Enterobacter pseudoroggenkampii]